MLYSMTKGSECIHSEPPPAMTSFFTLRSKRKSTINDGGPPLSPPPSLEVEKLDDMLMNFEVSSFPLQKLERY